MSIISIAGILSLARGETVTPTGSSYWRVACFDETSWEEMAFRDQNGDAIPASGGSAYESNHFGSAVAANMFDSNNATYWAGVSGGTSNWTGASGYLFPAPKDVRQVGLQRSSGLGGDGQTPEILIQFSQNGDVWRTVVRAATGSMTDHVMKWFDFTNIIPVYPRTDFGAHAYWRVRSWETLGGSPGGSAWTAMSALLFKDGVGSSIATTGGTALESGHFSTFDSSKLFDGTDATFWESSGIGHLSWAGYQFATPQTVMQVGLQRTASMDGSSPPISAQIEYSDDGVCWAPCGIITDISLTNNVPTYFDLAGML